MIQGTNDFVEDAVDLLRQGDHAFVLVAIHKGKNGFRTYNIRSGMHDGSDLACLRDILAKDIPRHLKEEWEGLA